MALGGALLAPFVPSTLAGAPLTACGGGLVKVYLSTPGMASEGVRRSARVRTAPLPPSPAAGRGRSGPVIARVTSPESLGPPSVTLTTPDAGL